MNLQKILIALTMLPLFIIGSCGKDDNPDVAPTIISTSPNNNAIDVPLESAITFVFSEEMEAASITTTNIFIMQGTLAVSGTVTYAKKKAIFTPIENLLLNKEYTSTVTVGVKSAAGLALATKYVSSFTTIETIIDETPPILLSTYPLDNAQNVPRNSIISWVFNEDMDLATINTSTFSLLQGNNAVDGEIAYINNKEASFKPFENLSVDAVFTAIITTGAKDLAGNALETNTSWTFTTSGSVTGLSPVNLGSASNYVILAKTAINNSSTSAITGDLGLSPAATSYITGLALVDFTGYATSAQVIGKIYAADMAAPTPVNLTTAVENMITAYNDAAGRPSPDFLELRTGNIGGETLKAGLYKWTNTVTIPSTVTLSGGADDVWIFQISGDLKQSAATEVILTGGAQAKNIFWQIAGEATFGATAHFEGIILSKTGITFQTGASMNGNALAQTAVILDANAITKLP